MDLLNDRAIGLADSNLTSTITTDKAINSLSDKHMLERRPSVRLAHKLKNNGKEAETIVDSAQAAGRVVILHGFCTTRLWCKHTCALPSSTSEDRN